MDTSDPYSKIHFFSCQQYCTGQGFTYSGVQSGTQCFCGNDKPADTSKAPASECNRACPADSTKVCGGTWRMNIYHFSASPGKKLRHNTSHFVHSSESDQKNPIAGFTLITSGFNCDWIMTKEECETAATELGLSVTTAIVPGSGPSRVPYCHFKPSDPYLFFKADTSSNPCSNERKCICKQLPPTTTITTTSTATTTTTTTKNVTTVYYGVCLILISCYVFQGMSFAKSFTNQHPD